MCGIFGFQTKNNAVLSAEQRGVLLTMLSLGNEQRGDDSWGFYNHKTLIKGLGGMSKYLFKFIKAEGGFGHTRRATTGSISIPNAHPFDIGNVIGAHNGIVFNHDELNKKYNREHEVDSMHIFSNLSEGKDLEEIRAYGSIQWVDKEDPNKILICKLSGGELASAAIENRKGGTIGVVWSSDEKHLNAALLSIGAKYRMFKLETGKVMCISQGKMFSTDRKLQFADRTYSETGQDWRSGYSGGTTSRKYYPHGSHWTEGDDITSEYQGWLSSRRGQTNIQPHLSNDQKELWTDLRDKSEAGKGNVDVEAKNRENMEIAIDRELQRALEADDELAFGPKTEEDFEIEESLDEPSKSSFVIISGEMVMIPDALAETDMKFENIVKGGSEFSHALGGWVKYDEKHSQFYVATNATETNGVILL